MSSDTTRDSLQFQLLEQRILAEQLRLLGSAVYVAGQGIAIQDGRFRPVQGDEQIVQF